MRTWGRILCPTKLAGFLQALLVAEWSPSQANAGDNCGVAKRYLMVVGQ